MEERTFDFGQVATVATTIPFTNVAKAMDITGYLLGKNIEHPMQLDWAIKECRESVLEQHPELTGIEPPIDVITKSMEDKLAWLEEQKSIYGDSFALKPIVSSKEQKR